ncbi:MAG: saccharopine dehydrogenase family protein [Flavobacteriales bacterium]
MKRILILGGGRSSSNLIKYLLDHAIAENLEVRLGDADLELASSKIGNHTHASCFHLDATNTVQREFEIENAHLVISMLPPHMHLIVAQDCLRFGRSLITPSYVPDGMWELNEQAKQKGVLILNEMGVDPGIDHMSAMQIISEIQAEGGKLESFESFTGGLIAPESDTNPWHYKITWNPRNIVMAGSGGAARYRENHQTKFIPYHQLFERITEVDLGADGKFEGYANRDSLKYATLYGLEDIPTLFRGTFRKSGYCEAWNALIFLGLTDESTFIPNASETTWKQLISSFTPEGVDPLNWLVEQLNLSENARHMLTWLGIFEEKSLDISEGSPALALQRLIEDKLRLEEGDKDMIVMWHRFKYSLGGNLYEIQSKLIAIGDDEVYTAMSKTVGLPIAIAAIKFLRGEISATGVQLPLVPEIFEPVLQELQQCGIVFEETRSALS